MTINNIHNQQGVNQLAFKARLFNKKGNQVRSFDDVAILGQKDQMASRGNPNTDIFIKDFISKKEENHLVFQNSVRLEINNPLFGKQEFTQDIHHETYVQFGCDYSSELRHMDLLTKSDRCEKLEDRALRGKIIDTIKTSIEHNQDCRLDPRIILENLLKNTDTSGFTEARIEDFKAVADKLNDELVQAGINELLYSEKDELIRAGIDSIGK